MFLHHKNIRFNDFSIKPTKKFKGTEKNGVTRQAEFVDDSYSSKTTHSKTCKIHITFLNRFQVSFRNVSCKSETNMNYYIAASARSPRYMNYQCLGITIKHVFQNDALRLAIQFSLRHRNNKNLF